MDNKNKTNLKKMFSDLGKDYFIRYKDGKENEKYNYFFVKRVCEEGLFGHYFKSNLEESLKFEDLFDKKDISFSMFVRPEQ